MCDEPPEVRNKTRIPRITSLNQDSIGSPRQNNKTKKRKRKKGEIKGIQTEKKTKQSLFEDDIMLYIENLGILFFMKQLFS